MKVLTALSFKRILKYSKLHSRYFEASDHSQDQSVYKGDPT